MDMKKVMVIFAVALLIVTLVGCGLNKDSSNGENNQNSNTNQKNTGNENKNNDNSSNPKKNNEDPKEKLEDISDYYPFKKNTRYHYEGAGNEYASFTVYNDFISGDRVQQRLDNGGTVMANVLELKDGKLTKVFSRGEAYYRENVLKSSGEDQEILLMEPLKKGTTWTLKDGRVRTITSMNTDITTPTGSYQAIEVTTENGSDKTVDYYAKEIGLIKSHFVTGGTEVTATLAKIEENVPLVQNINFYYPNIDDDNIYYKRKPISFYTNEITRKVITAAYKEPMKDKVGIVFSKNTEINSLYLNQDGGVYIDLNQAFLDEMMAGAAYEGLILQSIVNTVGQYYQAEKVFLTIDNKLYESGHITKKKGESFKVQLQGSVELK